MIRKNGIIALVVIAALFITVLFIFTDTWLEGVIEDYSSEANGAKVEIDGLDVSILSLKFSLNRLQVTDPDNTMRNMFETGNLTFQLNMPALFEKKIIVEKVRVDSFQTFTKRDYDGKIDKTKKSKEPGFIEKQLSKAGEKVKTELPVGQLASNVSNVKDMKLDDVLKTVKIKTPEKIDSLQKHYKERLDYWEKTLADTDAQKDIDKLQKELNAINPKKIKKVSQLKKYLKKVKTFKKSVDSLKKVYKTTQKDLAADLKAMKASSKQIKNWAKGDYDRAADQLNLPNFNKTKVAELLLGKKIMDMYYKFTHYHGKFSNYMEIRKSDKPEKVKPPRLKGQTIHFVKPQARPDFWIKEVQLSGKTSQNFIIEGNIKDICFQQQVIDKPTTLQLKGTRSDNATLTCSAVLDHIQDKYKDVIQFDLASYPVRNYKLMDNDYLPNSLQTGVGNAEIEFIAKKDTFNTRISLIVNEAAYKFSEKKDMDKNTLRLKGIVQDAFTDIKTVKVNSVFKVQKNKTKLDINSNLDKAFTRAMKNAMGKELQKMKGQLEAKVDAKIDPYKKKLESQLGDINNKLNSHLKKYEDKINTQEKAVNGKKKELEKEIGKKGKDLLKGLF